MKERVGDERKTNNNTNHNITILYMQSSIRGSPVKHRPPLTNRSLGVPCTVFPPPPIYESPRRVKNWWKLDAFSRWNRHARGKQRCIDGAFLCCRLLHTHSRYETRMPVIAESPSPSAQVTSPKHHNEYQSARKEWLPISVLYWP